MKKSILIGLSILSVFLLCSLSYQPIIAEKPIIIAKEKIEIVEDEDCGCLELSINDPPFFLWFICIPLGIMMFTFGILYLYGGIFSIFNFPELYELFGEIMVNLNNLGYRIGCGDLNWPNIDTFNHFKL